MSWYVLQVHTLRELEVRDDLKALGYQAAVPREMTIERHGGVWRERERLFFPGYVFTELRMTDTDYHRIHGVDHVLRILGQPTPLDADEALYAVHHGRAAKPIARHPGRRPDPDRFRAADRKRGLDHPMG